MLAYLLISKFVLNVYSVFGSSMEPTLSHGDRLIVSPVPFWFSEPQKGDVIAFPYRDDELFTKRVVGVGGSVIELIDGILNIDGEPVYDNFLGYERFNSGNISYPVTVPEDSVFVLGDNRDGSLDSRFSEVGCVKKSDIIGKIVLRIYPFDKIGTIDRFY